MKGLSRNVRLWMKFSDCKFSCLLPQSVCIYSISVSHLTLDKKLLLRHKNKEVKQITHKTNRMSRPVHLLTIQNHSAMPFL